jgi:hypothetical protein
VGAPGPNNLFPTSPAQCDAANAKITIIKIMRITNAISAECILYIQKQK